MLKRRKRALLQCAGIAVLALFALFYTQMDVSISGNEASRFAVIQALGEQDVFHISNTQFRTVDRLIREGKVYSDKPLPLSWCVGKIHRTVHRFSGLNFQENYHLLVYLYNLIAAGAVNILIFVWLFRHLCRTCRAGVESKFFLALAASLGTLLFSYSTVLNNHLPAALSFFGWFIALEKFRAKPDLFSAFLAGTAAGLTAALDIPTGFFACIFTLPALFFAGKKRDFYNGENAGCPPLRFLLAGSAGITLCAVWIAGLNFYAYKNILPLYIANGNGSYSPGTGMKNHWEYVTEALFSYRGFFLTQPFMFLALPWIWKKRRQLDASRVCVLLAVLSCIVFYLYMTNEFGGAAYGFRYLIPIIPVVWYFAAEFLLEVKSRAWHAAAVLLILTGIVTSFAGAYAPFCLAFEGFRSPPQHVTRQIRSTFAGNLFAWSYESDPESPLTCALIRHYGIETSKRYLFSAYLMLKKTELMGEVLHDRRFQNQPQSKPLSAVPGADR